MSGLGVGIKAVWIASAPRCGSMWAFNVTRRIVEAAGLEVLPTLVPQAAEAMVRAGAEGLGDRAANRVRVLKVHLHLPSEMPLSRFIVPRRDERDALMSFMRFMRCDFEEALDFVREAVGTRRHYDQFPRGLTLPLEYADISMRPASAARAIAGFLGAKIDDRTLLGIVRSYSKENVSRLIAKREQDVSRRSRTGQTIAADELVVLSPQNVRVFDTATGFQSGHVSRYREGDWRRMLTPEQQTRLDAELSALARSNDNEPAFDRRAADRR